MSMSSRLLLALLALGFLSTPAHAGLTSERVAFGLTRPVWVTAPAGDPDRLFIVEQPGTIKILDNGTLLGTPFLTVPDVDDTNNEQGLLGLAFDPDYDTNGFFYVYFTYDQPGAGNLDLSIIRRYKVSATNPDSADASSAHQIFEWPQDFANHNGGTLLFGPDGYLYLGLGDGGSGGDPFDRSQSPISLLGKMIRIDPDGDDFPADPDQNYRIPPTNPFVGDAGIRDEIWAFGLRNPYRWSFDRLTGDMWIGDVGQNVWEEIDFQPASSAGGENYGWRCYEGNNTYNTSGCGPFASYDAPVHVYSHSLDGFSCSVTGGNVYRGAEIAEFQGTYFFADYCSNQIYSFEYVDDAVTNLTNRTTELIPNVSSIGQVSAFGEDGLGEMYIVDLGGEIFKMVLDPVDAPEIGLPTEFAVTELAPNPFRQEDVRFQIRLDRAADVQVEIFDAAGRRVQTLLEGPQAAGVYSLAWDGVDRDARSTPAGVYFVRVQAGDEVLTRKVTRLR